MQEKRHFYIPT